MAVAQDGPAQPAALPAVVHKPQRVISRRRGRGEKKSSSLRSRRSLREKYCPQSYSFADHSLAIFPAFF
jgi:hypothetical protein